MPSMNRREFLHDTTALAAALAGAGLIAGRSPAAAKKKGDANDQLHVAVIGVNGRGMSHVHDFANKHGCVITTICDCDSAVIAPAMKHVEKQQGKPPRFEQDLRPARQVETVLPPFDALRAAGRDDLHVAPRAAEGDRRDGRGARAGAGGFGRSNATLPNQDPHAIRGLDGRQLDVRTIREQRVHGELCRQ